MGGAEGACAPNNWGLEGAFLSHAPPIIQAQRGRAPPIFSSEHPQYFDHNHLPGFITSINIKFYISDTEKEKRNAEMKFFGAVTAVFLITALLLPNFNRGSDDQPIEQDTRNGTTTYNEFFHTMLQAGEVQEIVIAPALNRAIIMLRPNAVIKVISRIFGRE